MASHTPRAGEPSPSAADWSLTGDVMYPQALSTGVETGAVPEKVGGLEARRIIAPGSHGLPSHGVGLGDLFELCRPLYSARQTRSHPTREHGARREVRGRVKRTFQPNVRK